jgi:ribosomal protein S18 acetylase RimI-like enzyme
MDKFVRKIELPLAKKIVENAGLYIVPKSRIKELARIAADAYEDYPLHNWFSGGKYDEYIAEKTMEISLKTMADDAVMYADSEELSGFAVWLPLGFNGSKTLPFLANGGLNLILHSGFGIVGRLVAYEKYAMEQKKLFTGNVDWYLYNLSVKKSAQGKGIAGRLLRPMLQFCDRENIVSYLETNKESNVSLYQHFGFELSKKEFIPKTSVMHYAMVRKPSPEDEEGGEK